MTTIAIDRNGMIAADKRAVLRYTICSDKVKKIHQVENDYVMFSGSLIEGMNFVDWYSSGEVREDKPDISGVTILIMKYNPSKLGVPYTVYMVLQAEGNTYIDYMEVDLPIAIGSGGDIALGAMLAGCDSERAVKIASQVDTSTGSSVDVVLPLMGLEEDLDTLQL